MQLSSIMLHMSTPVSFESLKKLGWVHPLDYSTNPLVNSLVKSYHALLFQIVLCQGSADKLHTWQEVFVHDKRNPSTILKGKGQPFGTMDIIEALTWFEEELNLAAKGS